MANDLNRCEFIGRLGQDVETRYASSGNAVANFSIACGYKYKDQESTEWVRVVAFGKLAEICDKYLRKGSQVFIAGRMQTRRWEDKQGVTKYTTEIIANDMQMLDSKGGSSQERDTRPQPTQQPADDFSDSIPF